MNTVFISHSSVDKEFVLRLAFELLAEGVSVWLDNWELGLGDPLISKLEGGLNSSVSVLVVVSKQAAKSKWVDHEMKVALKAEEQLGRRLIIPLTLEGDASLPILGERLYIDFSEGQDFLQGVHALVDYVRKQGLSATDLADQLILPLRFHRGTELDTYLLDRIFHRWISDGYDRSKIGPECMQLVKSEEYVDLQKGLRKRISQYMKNVEGTSEGLADLRKLDADVVRRERDIRERSALILREFGYGFGLSNGHLIDSVRQYTRIAMHYLICTLRGTRSESVQSIGSFLHALEELPGFNIDPKDAKFWGIDDPIKITVRHSDLNEHFHTTATVIVAKNSLRVSEQDIEHFPGVPFRGAFDFDTTVNVVLPQLVHWAILGVNFSPSAWDEDVFRIYQKSDW